MKVLVCGSRDWKDYGSIWNRLYRLNQNNYTITIIHGAASRKVDGIEESADMLAHKAAYELGFPIERFPANWKKYGKVAGFKRNLEMLDQKPDLVIAFQKDNSRGTQHTMDNARERGIEVEVHHA